MERLFSPTPARECVCVSQENSSPSGLTRCDFILLFQLGALSIFTPVKDNRYFPDAC